jgi:hypothetical protein
LTDAPESGTGFFLRAREELIPSVAEGQPAPMFVARIILSLDGKEQGTGIIVGMIPMRVADENGATRHDFIDLMKRVTQLCFAQATDLGEVQFQREKHYKPGG